MALDLGSYFGALQQPGPNRQPAVQSPYPPGYRTPEDIKSAYDYAQALLKQSQGAVPGTKGGWTVGVQHIVDALVGGDQAYRANQGELAARGYDASSGLPKPPSPYTPNTTSDPAPAQSSASPAGADKLASIGDGDSGLNKLATVTKGQESGKYDNVTTTISQRTGKPQRALGAYGIMDFHVGPNGDGWDKEVLGHVMTPEELLKNPAAQDAIYKAKMGQYVKQYGVEGAGRAWIGGPGGVDHPDRADPLGTKVGDYGRKFAAGAGAPQDSMIQALSAKSRGGEARLVAGVPAGQTDTPIISPFAIRGRPQYNRQQIERLQASPWQTDQQKALTRQEYMEQNQPLQVPYLGGNVIVNPRNPNQQFFSPGIHWGDQEAKGVKAPLPQTILPPGYTGGAPQVQELPTQGAAPAAPAGGSAAPPPPITPSAPIAVPGGPGPQGAVAPPAAAPGLALGGPAGASDAANSPVAQAAAAAAPVVPPAPAETSNQALAAAQGAAAKPPSIIPNAPPPAAAASPMGDKVAAALGAAPTAPGAGTQVAEVSPKLKELADFGLKLDQQGELNKTDAAQYTKNLQQYTDLGIRGANALPGLEIANKMLADKRYYSGIGADLWEGMGKLKALVGIDKNAAAPMEIFNKILSGNIVTDLKTMLGGLGQIRLAEINLITNSVANKYNTPAANAAVLQMMKREYERTAKVGQIAAAYAKGWQLDDKDQWVPRQGMPTSAGLQQQVLGYTQRHPLFSDDEIKNIEHLFNMSPKTPNAAVPFDKTRADLAEAAHIGFAGSAQAGEAPGAAPAQAAPTAQFKAGDTATNRTTGEKLMYDGTKWGPAPK